MPYKRPSLDGFQDYGSPLTVPSHLSLHHDIVDGCGDLSRFIEDESTLDFIGNVVVARQAITGNQDCSIGTGGCAGSLGGFFPLPDACPRNRDAEPSSLSEG